MSILQKKPPGIATLTSTARSVLERDFFSRLRRLLKGRDKKRKRTRAVPADPAIVDSARLNFKKVYRQDVMPASLRWEAFRERIQQYIEKAQTPEEVIFYAQKYVEFDHRAPDTIEKINLYGRTLADEFGPFYGRFSSMGDSSYSLPHTLFRHKKRGVISNVFFYHLRYLLFCLAYIKEPRTICEVGGGYGSVARLWLKNPVYKPSIYVIVDFAECLFFAEVFLRVNIKELDILYVTSEAPLDTASLKAQTVILCPIANIKALSGLNFDLVINTGSMQEMPESWVDFWMNWLKNQNCRYFYSLNSFAHPLENMKEMVNAWSPRLSPEWMIRLQRFDPPFVKQQGAYRFAEILAEKIHRNVTDPVTLAARYDATKQRYMDGQLLLECMDVVRLYPREDIVWDLLKRCHSEMKPIPKEAYWLACYLSSLASTAFKEKRGAEFEQIWSDLKNLRTGGREDVFKNNLPVF